MMHQTVRLRRHAPFILCALTTLTLLFSSDADAATACANIKNLVFMDTTITLSQSYPAGSEPAPGYVIPIPICRVVAHISPASDSDILIEAWLPATAMDWNGKFLGTGTGLFFGQIMYSQLMIGIQRGYATLGTDTGHYSPNPGTDASWALGHPEKVTDFINRAVHEMTVKGKAITEAFYGLTPQRSYWLGCSTAGQQGLKEAQVHPEDYDGITVSAPVNNWSHQMGAHLYNAVTALKNGPSAPEYIPPEKWTLMANAALAVCDSRDGVADGLIGDPPSCNFDPATLQCPSGDASTCLTATQVQTAKKIYGGAKFSNGQSFYPGLPPSSEILWAPVLGGPEPYAIAREHFKYLVYGNPSWDWHTFNPDTAVPLADSVQAAGINAIDPNLGPFKARGGKLILWHGWLDPIIFAKNSVDYYLSVVDAMGGTAQTDNFFRLFMAPGVEHCGGGPGPNIIDNLTALERWVEQAIPPAQIEADHYSGGFANGTIDRRLNLCPYPQVPTYRGSGDVNAAENFFCQTPNVAPPQSVVAISGTPQNATAGTPFASALQAKVTDASLNPLVGVAVTFTAPSSGASATVGSTNSITIHTNTVGIATSPVPAANSTAGSYNVTASVAGVATPATFSLTNTTVSNAPTTIFGNTAPTSFFVETTPVEVGVKFRSDLNGTITAVRYYKAASDNSTHTGSLWSATGSLLATGTFTGGTASGWQQLNFSAPVAITANTTYVASNHSGGTYHASSNYFQVAGVDTPPLHALRNGVDGVNGVYIYGAGGVFPNQSFQSSNYWVDVVFVPGTGSGPGSPQSIVVVSGTPQSATVGTTFGSALQAKVTDASSNPLAGVAVTFTAPSSGASATVGSTNSITVNTNGAGIAASPVPMANSIAGSYNVTASVAGVATPATFSLTNSTVNNAPTTIFNNTAPTSFFAETTPVEVGVKFRSDLNGTITAVRYYKAASDNSTHTGSLWSATGSLLATGTFTGGTASGWQQLNFSAPVAITANTTYVASNHSGGTYYASSNYFQVAGVDTPPLHALRNGVDGVNGVYVYGAGGVFPNQGFQSSNYWVDVVFVPSGTGGGTGSPQSIVVVSGTPQSATVGTTFGSALQAKVTDASSNPLAGVAVTFTAPSSGASATVGSTNSITVNTNGAGIAASPVPMANSIAGSYNVTASVAGVATPATFSLTNSTVNNAPTTIFNNTAPTSFFAETTPVEVGVKFRSDLNGTITAVRYYKAASDNSTHTGSLWSATGSLLATGTFTGGTASGWQQLNFSAPVAITANTTYVASNHSGGTYYASSNYFQVAGVDTPPLHALRNGVDGVNGVYVYGAGGVFPNQGFQSSNYWVDVVFVPSGTGGGTGSPQSIVVVSGTPQSATVGTTFGSALQAKVTDASSNPLAGVAVTFTAPSSGASATVGSTNSITVNTNGAGIAASPVPMANSIAGSYNVTASVAGVATPATFSLSNTTASSGALTIFGAAAPTTFFADSPVEVGVKFRSDVPGMITGIRYYKKASDNSTHTGSLWSATGTLLATGTFTGGTASGWQQLNFSAPVAITANTTYVASYHAGGGYFALDSGFQNAGFDNAPLHALKAGTDGVNGVYVYGPGGIFPNQSYLSSNYWADVTFVPN